MEIEAPDGTVIEFPDDTPVETIKGVMAKRYGGPSQPQASFGRGSVPSREMTPSDWQRIGRRLDDAGRAIASGATFGFADEIAAGADALTGTGTYEENVAAERARDAEIPAAVRIPGEIVGGIATGTGLSRAGVTLLKNAKPTVASLAGRGAAEGAAYGAAYGAGHGEDLQGRAEEALYGAGLGAAGGAVTGGITARMMRAKGVTPTVESVKGQASAAYKAAEDAGVILSGKSVAGMADDLANEAKQLGFHPKIHTKVAAALEAIEQSRGQPQSLNDMELLRRIMGSAAKSNEADERRIASALIDALDERMGGLSASDLVAGDAAATSSLKQARELWGRSSKAQLIEDMVERARIRSSQFSGSGYENALRTEFRHLSLNRKRMRGFSKEERDAINRVALGGPIDNALQKLGKLAPTGIVSGALGSGIGYTAAGPVGALAVPAVGLLARAGATQMTKANAQRAVDLMLAGAGPGQPITLSPAQVAFLRSVLIGESQQAVNSLPSQQPLSMAR